MILKEARLKTLSLENWEELFWDIATRSQKTDQEKDKLLDIQKQIYPYFRLLNKHSVSIAKKAIAMSNSLNKNPSFTNIIKNWANYSYDNRVLGLKEIVNVFFASDNSLEKYAVEYYNQNNDVAGFVALEEPQEYNDNKQDLLNVLRKIQHPMRLTNLINSSLPVKNHNTMYLNINSQALNVDVFYIVGTIYHELTHLKQQDYSTSSDSAIERIVALNRQVYLPKAKCKGKEVLAYAMQPIEQEAFCYGDALREVVKGMSSSTSRIDSLLNKKTSFIYARLNSAKTNS